MAVFEGTDGNDDIFAVGTGNTFLGLDGEDTLEGQSGLGNNILRGGDDNDLLFAADGDQLFGDDGDDELEGDTSTGNILSGGDGNDTIFVGSDDRAFGDAGQDIFFIVGPGRSSIYGGSGGDIFIIPTDDFNEASTVKDFTPGIDRIGIGSGVEGVTSFDDLSFETVDNGVVINVGEQAILLVEGVAAPGESTDPSEPELSEADFVFGDPGVAIATLPETPDLEDASFTIPDDSENGSLVGTITATPIDENDTLTYEITENVDLDSDTNPAFAIDENGDLIVTDADDVELATEDDLPFALTVEVTDQNGFSDTALVNIDTFSAPDSTGGIQLNQIGTFATGIFDEGAAEIVAFDPTSQRLFVVNGDSPGIDVLDLSDPTNPTLVDSIDVSLSGGPNSVAVANGIVAVALEDVTGNETGTVAFYDAWDLSLLNLVGVGVLPDAVTFTPDGTKLLVANEGEPVGDGDFVAIDPEGTISIIDLSTGIDEATVSSVDFSAFNGRENDLRGDGVRIFPGRTVAQDLEPEFIAVAPDGNTAFVTLQENNAVAVVDIETATVLDILPLGVTDFSRGLPTIETFDIPELTTDDFQIGTDPDGNPIFLGGLSSLTFDGFNPENGNPRFLAINDRGPVGGTIDTPDPDSSDRPFLVPELQVTVLTLELDEVAGQVSIVDSLGLTREVTVAGVPFPLDAPITGLPNIPGFFEVPVDPETGNPLPNDFFGLDSEGITRDRSTGNLYIADEQAPSINVFSAEGVLIDRFVPIGYAAQDEMGLAPGTFGSETLPDVYLNRRNNRGFEGIAFDDEQNILYGFIQTPLSNPDTTTSNGSSVLRILGINPETGEPVEEYVYNLQSPALVTTDPDTSFGSAEVDRIGDAVFAGDGQFYVIERDNEAIDTAQQFVFKIHLKGATNILGTEIANATAGETLESLSPDKLIAAGIQPVHKIKVTNLPSLGFSPSAQTEGLALLSDGRLAVLNDNDYEGPDTPTQLGLISFDNATNGLDPSNEDGGINISNFPVFGLFQPDSIATFEANGQTFFITANEGDGRDSFDDLTDIDRVRDLPLDPNAFPDAANLQLDENLGRLEVSLIDGDIDGDGDFDQLFAFGSRSFSIRDALGNIVFDSGDQLAQITAAALPDDFNSDNDENGSFDNRSDDGGPEPEGVAVGVVGDRTYAFIGLERIGGVAVYDVSDPANATFVQYINNRDFSVDLELPDGSSNPAAGDSGPEGLVFISADDSPNGIPLLVVANEVSGTTTVYEIEIGDTPSPTTDALISEFQPNPAGDDPETQTLELSGTPGESFEGVIVSIESDNTTGAGTVDRATSVTGIFDANGLLTVDIPDLENPSFTVALLSDFTGTVGTTDIDTDNDGVADDLSTLGTVLDAIGVPDAIGDEIFLYGADLGGTDFAFTGDEPGLIFRGASVGELFAINDPANGQVFDITGTDVTLAIFDTDPTGGPTFGAINPTVIASGGDGFDLQITEIWAGQEGEDLTEDWFEITNVGSQAWVSGIDPELFYDDDSQDPAVADLIAGINQIDPGESVVVVLGTASDADTFSQVWNSVIDLNGVDIGFADGSGLSRNGDGVTLFVGGPTADTLADFEAYPSPPSGLSYDVNLADFSVAGENGAVATDATAGSSGDEPAVGSPGNGAPILAVTPIYDIQGAGHLSAFAGSDITTTGIVTAIAFNGFYLQDATGDGNDSTSDGIFVAGSTAGIAVGDGVEVTGTVVETIPGGAGTGNLSITQITATDTSVITTGNRLPAAVVIGTSGRLPSNTTVISDDELPVNLQNAADDVTNPFDPENDAIDFYESLEGQLVTIEDAVAVSPTRVFGAFSAEAFTVPNQGATANDPLNGRGGITLNSGPDNTGDQNPERVQIQFDPTISGEGTPPGLNVGDQLGDVTGVVGYSFGNFEVTVTGPVNVVTPGGLTQEVTPLVGSESQLTVASYNVLNLTSTSAVEGGVTDPDATQRSLLAQQIVTNLGSPDIIALQEIQDNDGVEGTNNTEVSDATETLQDLVDAIAAAGGPTYEFFDVFDGADAAEFTELQGGVPSGNIRNAFLYNPDRVSLASTEALTPANLTAAGVSNPEAFAGSRVPIVGTFTFNGESVTVVNNHFSSRFGSTPVFGGPQPFVQAGEDAREAQSQAINDFVDSILATDPNANVIVAGDLNTFPLTNDLAEILPGTGADQVLTNLVSQAEAQGDAYTFIFDGNSQVLDHTFVTDSLLADAEFDIVHVNNDFTRDDNGITFSDTVVASDHELLVSRFTIGNVEPENFTLQLLHASDLEGGVDAISAAPNFAAIASALEAEFDNTIILSAGDNFISGPFFNAASDSAVFNAIFEGLYNTVPIFDVNGDGIVEALVDVSAIPDTADTDGNSFLDNGEIDAFLLSDANTMATTPLTAADVYVTDINGDGDPDFFDEIDNFQGRVDITLMNLIGFAASALGNHEFDLGTDTLENIINYDSEEGNSLSSTGEASIVAAFPDHVNFLQEVDFPGIQFPYLSSNLDFAADPEIGNLFTDEILFNTAFQSDLLSARNNPVDLFETASDSNDDKIAPSTVIDINGELVGVVGATTPLLEAIASPGAVVVNPASDLTVELAAIIQAEVDELLAFDDGSGRILNKVVLVSHLQQFALESQELAPLLSGIDIIVAGGSDQIVADQEDIDRGLQPGDTIDDLADVDLNTSGQQIGYPFVAIDADGNPVAVVSTDGEYSYVGRLVVEFDDNGLIIPERVDPNVSGAFATTDDGVAALFGSEDPFAEGTSQKVVQDLVNNVTQVVNDQDGNIFGQSDVFLNGARSSVRNEETNLGNLTADANIFVAREIEDVDTSPILVSIKNGGGIRDIIGFFGQLDDGAVVQTTTQANPAAGKEAGDVSQLDVGNTLRFNNGLELVTLTPEQLLEVLEHAVAESQPDMSNEPGQFAQVGNIRFSFDPTRVARTFDPDTLAQVTAGERVQSVVVLNESTGEFVTVVENGAVIADAPAAIRVVTLDFLEGGGDAYPFEVFEALDPIFYNEVSLEDTFAAADPTSFQDLANFADAGSEQDALAELFAAEFNEDFGGIPFDIEDTLVAEDERIQNLSFREDAVLVDRDVEMMPPTTINGTVGDDLGLLVPAGDHLVFAGDGNDLVIATTGDGGNVINGGRGNDRFILGRDDTVLGGSGNDTFLVDEGGDNLLFGGNDADTFVIINAGSAPNSANTIGDFNALQGDLIEINGTGLSDISVLTLSGTTDTTIALNGDELAILLGVDSSRLVNDNFIFSNNGDEVSMADNLARVPADILLTDNASESLDLRAFSDQSVNINVRISREASFDNVVGVYTVDDMNGAIGDLLPGQAGYTAAALERRIADIALTTENRTMTEQTLTVDGGFLYAPFLIVNGNFDNFDNIYFPYLEANSDGFDHLRMIGDDAWGFEDLPGGGDRDYNDLVITFETIA